MKHIFQTLARMIVHRESKVILQQLITRTYANQRSLILRCDLHEPQGEITAKIPLNLRLLREKDLPSIIRERPRRLPLLLEKIPTCYVAFTSAGEPAYINWVVFNTDWERFSPYFAGRLHKELESNECVFEFAYTFEKFRGLGVMGAALRMIIAEIAHERPHVRWGYTYILDKNIPSLKGCRNAGFQPYMQREEHWRALHMRQVFSSIDCGKGFPFEDGSPPIRFDQSGSTKALSNTRLPS